MGRSGGGHRSGGGGGHHSGGGSHYHSSSYHHHHYYSSGGYYSSEGSCLSTCLGFIIVIMVILAIVVGCELFSSNLVDVDASVGNCEQVVVCPETIQGGTISFETKGDFAKASLVKKLPSISKTSNAVHLNPPGQYVGSYDYVYRSFNLVKGSSIKWDITGSNSFKLILIKGYKNFQNFEDDESYNYVKANVASHQKDSYTALMDDEYFIVADGYYGSVQLSNIQYDVTYFRYEVEGHEEKTCTSSCDFSVSSSDIPGACVIVEQPCGLSEDSTDIDVSYYAARTWLYWASVAVAGLIGLTIVGGIITCLACCFRKKMKSGTVVVGDLGTSASKETQPIISSQTTPSAYQSTPSNPPYNPVPPAYVYSNPSAPSAPPPSYDPYGTSTYGAALV